MSMRLLSKLTRTVPRFLNKRELVKQKIISPGRLSHIEAIKYLATKLHLQLPQILMLKL